MRAIEGSDRRKLNIFDQSRWKWGSIVVFIVALQFAISYRDSHFGLLAVLVPWDDNGILDEGLHRLAIKSSTRPALRLETCSL
jgi:hypothetical protein